jgi:hypothetical protein
VACQFGLLSAQPVPDGVKPWQGEVFRDLCSKYLEGAPSDAADAEERAAWLDRLTRHIGQRLAASGLEGASAEDIAILALLQTQPILPLASADPRLSIPPQPEPLNSTDDSRGGGEEGKEPDTVQYSDISKGEEGYLQAVDRLAELPVSERLVMTGDITAGFQSASVSGSPALSSAFGRTRMNFVVRATPATPDGRFSDGNLFVQLIAAGGAFDASEVGGPSAFSPLNDVATERSSFNEGLSRGNVYLNKVFYQQQARLGGGSLLGRVGVLDFSDYFDANEFANNEARQFINGAFVNSAAFKGGLSAPGFMVELDPSFKQGWLRGAVFRMGYGITRIERAFTSPLWTFEAELKPWLRSYQGTWRLGSTIGNVSGAGGVQGFYLSVNQWVSRRVGVYGRFAVANSGAGSLLLGPARQSYSGGLQWRFIDEADRVSAWGFGFSQAWGIEQEHPLATERVIETYYRWQLADRFSLSPSFQLVLGSGGDPSGGTHLVFGVRTNFAH